jgi:hypothetical protein
MQNIGRILVIAQVLNINHAHKNFFEAFSQASLKIKGKKKNALAKELFKINFHRFSYVDNYGYVNRDSASISAGSTCCNTIKRTSTIRRYAKYDRHHRTLPKFQTQPSWDWTAYHNQRLATSPDQHQQTILKSIPNCCH